jgi:FAD:protein FMN transferase
MGSTTAEPRVSGYVTTRARVALGTFVTLEAEAPVRASADGAITAAWEAILTVERVMHPQRGGSDLSVLANCAPGTVIEVHSWTWDVLRRCQELHAATDGAFDPCPSAVTGGLLNLDLLPCSRVRVRAPTRLDLGGIAKGYAVDRALQALRDRGCTAGLVNAGGDLAVFGEGSRTIWLDMPGGSAPFDLKDAALASSDTGAVERPSEHRGYYHGADRCLQVSGRATVTASCAVWADALTKCALLLAPESLALLLKRLEARVLVCTRAAQRQP